ncbi:MAG: hypothetical protein L0154_20450 [Chloroflexi bacterium]|nr:hypothetical protein [Chloroflexota bacterium]
MYRRLIFVVIALCVMVMLTTSLSAQTDMVSVQHTSAVVRSHPSQGDVRDIAGAQAELFATEDGLMVHFQTTELEEGHVYTLWVAIVNNPENCQATPCAAPDVLTNDNNTNAEVTYGDGILVGPDHRMEFSAFLPAGDVNEPWFTYGVTNPLGAQVHAVINDHGPLIPELATSMLNSYRGGCADESIPPPFPDSAKADGEPGLNTCRLIQVAIFQQEQ